MILVALGLAYSAPKLLPVALWVSSDQFADVRTVLPRPDGMTTEMVLRTYFDRYQNRGIRYDGQRSGWYGTAITLAAWRRCCSASACCGRCWRAAAANDGSGWRWR